MSDDINEFVVALLELPPAVRVALEAETSRNNETKGQYLTRLLIEKLLHDNKIVALDGKYVIIGP